MNDHTQFDVAIIGGGILGCFAARNLTRYRLNTVLIEAASDVCTGITRANSAVIYAGYDHVPGSLKADYTLLGNASMERLCDELEVAFSRKGSLMTACGPRGERTLQIKLDQGNKNNVTGLKLLTGDEARELEPMLGESVTRALWAPSTATVNPWRLGIAAYECALQNGCVSRLNTKVCSIARDGKYYVLETNKESFRVKMVLNCAGLAADQIREMLFPPYVRLRLDATDFLVFDKDRKAPSHILFQETEEKKKGITAVPCTEGNLLVESPARALSGDWFSTDYENLMDLQRRTQEYLPELDLSGQIKSFGAVRPNPYYVKEEDGALVADKEKITSFVIDRPEGGFISLIGIKTPGLTCADQLGGYLAKQAAKYLDAKPNTGYSPRRKAILRPADLEILMRELLVSINPSYGEILCRCEQITEGEVKEAIRRGATDLNGIRRRLGVGMGVCQGSRCRRAAEKLLQEVDSGTF